MAEGDAEVALGGGIVGGECEGVAEGGDGFGVSAGEGECGAELGVGFGEVGVFGEEELIGFDGFIEFFGALEDDAEGEAEVGDVVGDFDGFADEGFGFVEVSGGTEGGGEEVEGVLLVGIGLEDLAVDIDGLVEFAGLLVLEGEFECLVDGELAHGDAGRGKWAG